MSRSPSGTALPKTPLLPSRAGDYIFVDTNALTTLLLGLRFGQVTEPVPPALLRYALECRTRYLHHFVCADDIPYEEEPGVRENAAWRTQIQQLVLEDLDRRGIAYTILTGSLEQRAARVLDHACSHRAADRLIR